MNLHEKARQWIETPIVGDYFAKYICGNCTFAEAAAEAIDELIKQPTASDLDREVEKVEIIEDAASSAEHNIALGEDPELVLRDLIEKIHKVTTTRKPDG